MKTVRRLVVLLVVSVLLATTVYAADIDKMTLDELKKAYRELEQENKDLKSQLFDLQNAGSETEETKETEPVETVQMTTEDFLKDIVKS